MIENPNRKEANQVAILQAQWRIWTTKNKSSFQDLNSIISPALGHTASFFTPRPHNLLRSLIQKLSP